MGRRLSRAMLTAHVTTSVGWTGAAAAFAALAVVAATSQDDQLVRAAYRVLAPVTRLVIVPAAAAALLTGLVQALAGPWGLLRHYWVLVKLLVTVVLTLLLLRFLPTVDQLAGLAADPTTSTAELRPLGASALVHAVLAVLALLVPTVLSIFKPRGTTGWRRRRTATADVA